MGFFVMCVCDVYPLAHSTTQAYTAQVRRPAGVEALTTALQQLHRRRNLKIAHYSIKATPSAALRCLTSATILRRRLMPRLSLGARCLLFQQQLVTPVQGHGNGKRAQDPRLVTADKGWHDYPAAVSNSILLCLI